MSGSSDQIEVAFKGQMGAFSLDVAFDVPMRGVTGLFGPSGCGKTTILRSIAGLHHNPGRLALGADTWQDTARGVFLPPHRREVGYVFQEASLFPHLSVRDNLLYGARRAAADKADGRRTTAELSLDDVVSLLGLSHLLDRSPEKLSGGERQRVAVGRALLARPRILLMDEPLSALDRMTKEDILPYFEMLHEALSVPIIYVSHDLAEIERLADTLVLLDKGRVLACGSLQELQTDLSLPLLTMPGATVVLDGTAAARDETFMLTRFDVAGGHLIVPGLHGALGQIRRLRISASDVSLAKSAATDSTILNCLPARIVSIDDPHGGPQVTVILALGADDNGDRIAARITRRSLTVLALKPGDDVYAQIKSVALVAARTGRALPEAAG